MTVTTTDPASVEDALTIARDTFMHWDKLLRAGTSKWGHDDDATAYYRGKVRATADAIAALEAIDAVRFNA